MIEKDLGRIADALEIIAGVMDDKAVDAGKKSVAAAVPLPVEVPVEEKAPEVEVPAAPVPDAPTLPEPEVPAAPTPAPEAPATQMTPEELNYSLVEEFNRLGSREGIDKAFQEFGAKDVTTLMPADYADLLEKVKVL